MARPLVLTLVPSRHVAGDFTFMSLVGSLDPPTAPPTRIQPPARTLHETTVYDYGIFCNLQPGNRYWMALVGGSHCAAYVTRAQTVPARANAYL